MKLNFQEILQKFKINKLNIILIFLAILIGLLSFVYLRNGPVYINYENYEKLLNSNSIESARIKDDKVYLKFNGREYIILKEAVNLKELYKITKISKQDNMPFWAEFIVLCFIVLVLIILVDRYFRKNLSEVKNFKNEFNTQRNFTTNIQKSNEFVSAISDYKFSDVAGIDEVKSELLEIVDFLKNPEKYKDFGIVLPKGVLMSGPPGVGKTLIAKAVAGEAGVPFYYESGANFAQMFVGVGAQKVRELFAHAKSNAPSIVFIDEIDAIGKSRGGNRNDEREATLNQLLTEMDGFEDSNGVIVMGATNKIEMIDDALLRPGRFDRRVFISLPNYKDRINILKLYLKNKSHNVDLSKLSRMSVGFSGAGLATFVNEAMISALKRGSKTLEMEDFEKIKTKVASGKRKEIILSESEKEIQALYQGAKALSAYWFGLDFDKINLLEDDFVKNDIEIESKTTLENRLKVYLSGIAALFVYKEDMFSNSKIDLKKSLNLAHNIVYEYGMGNSFIPNSEDVSSIVNNNYLEVKEFLKNMQNVLFEISKYIFAFEVITSEEIKKIIEEQYTKDNNEDKNRDTNA
ncbi:integral membrane ATP-dependent zinc metallopeptidase [Campylobacter blaseri]|uniref:AAA family ATPase n=1 Tax=Campylobacter blaseri TaxID=2042961 RepID=A0A2P8R2G8_9BACT|nr:AAA family ATPase [Campylobacter blaseri]PSM52658.1 AAA family ATPase [Campylobacter blaseri]PSM54306.1 AAA family ATPase [Campylobacter blaseri]QKF85957.1 integral membrane ATP-dependent zinc metallopeptidase [Campylobacter blaseri]